MPTLSPETFPLLILSRFRKLLVCYFGKMHLQFGSENSD